MDDHYPAAGALPPISPRLLTRRGLNRALLARQHLLERSSLPVTAMIEHLVGLQSQEPRPPYIGLWTRLHDFHPEQLSRLLIDREVVRISLMRGTIHLVTARDCLALRPVVQPIYDAYARNHLRRELPGVDPAELARAHRELLTSEPLTAAAAGRQLLARWPEHKAIALGHVASALLPLVQPPPRGIWGTNAPSVHIPADHWLGQPFIEDGSPDAMLLRYLAAFGPASVKDARQWSGLPGLGDAFNRLRPDLVSHRDEHGVELFDLPGAPLPDPETPAPVRFLPAFDNLLLSHHDRTRIIAPEYKPLVFTVNGIIKPTILVDGVVQGLWKVGQTEDQTRLTISPFIHLESADRSALETEGARLLSFLAESGGGQELIWDTLHVKHRPHMQSVPVV